MKKILTSFKSRKKQKMILEEILIDRANNGILGFLNIKSHEISLIDISAQEGK